MRNRLFGPSGFHYGMAADDARRTTPACNGLTLSSQRLRDCEFALIYCLSSDVWQSTHQGSVRGYR